MALVLDGNYDEVVGSDKTQFLEECTDSLSSDGSVECVDVRRGSIIVDIRGSTAAVDAVVAEVESKGLDLPSFPVLSVSTYYSLNTNTNQPDTTVTNSTASTQESCPQCGVMTTGQSNCCGKGGSWHRQCGPKGSPRPHTWGEGLAACVPTTTESTTIAGLDSYLYYISASETFSQTTVSIVLDGDFDDIIGSDKTQFLEECTDSLSSDGSVECVDVRRGSIIVDIRGSTAAVDAVVAEVESKGLDLPSFPVLSVMKANKGVNME